MRALQFSFAVLILMLASVGYSQADSDIAPFSYVDGYPKVLVLDGPISDRTPLSFSRALTQKPEVTTIVLASPGGALQSGLIIAEKIHERGLNTLILPDTECASACAFLFLAGKERLALGRLGVHQVSGNMDLGEAQLNLSDAIEILDRFGVSPEVTKRMLRTPSAQMYWFTPQELTAFGLNSSLPATANEMPVPAQNPEAAVLSMDDRALTFVRSWIDISTSSSYSAMASSAPYAQTVLFFDKFRSRTEVMTDKQRYAERWPVRTAVLRPETLRSTCEGTACIVTGEYQWSVANPAKGKGMAGLAEFRYRLLMENNISIIEEGGKVLSKAAR